MSISSWLQKTSARMKFNPRRLENRRKCARRAKPTIELLEDRAVPSTLVIDDVAVVASPSGQKVREAAVQARFRVQLLNASTETVTANFATADASAAAGVNYHGVSGTVTFAPGEREQFIDVPVFRNLVREPHRAFVVNLSNANGADIADGQAVGTILDNARPVVPAQTVFATSFGAGVSGDPRVREPFPDFRGILGADQTVTMAALQPGNLPGWNRLDIVYHAILSDTRIDARDHIQDRIFTSAQIYNTAGQLLATDHADFFDGTIAAPIGYDQAGRLITTGTQNVWLGTTPPGVASSATCGNWDGTGPTATGGSFTSRFWMSGPTLTCSTDVGRLLGISPASLNFKFGATQALPLLPSALSGDLVPEFRYDDVSVEQWFEVPRHADLRYSMNSGSRFVEALLPGGANGAYVVEANGATATFAPGDRVDFDTFQPGGVADFRIVLVGSDSATVGEYPIRLSFDSAQASFSITPNTVSIPGGGGTIEGFVDNADVVVRKGSTELFRSPLSSVYGLDLRGSSDSETFDINIDGFTPANLPLGFSITGGEGVGDNDTLVINGSQTVTNYQYTTGGPESGTIDMDGLTIVFDEFEPILDNLSAVNRVVTIGTDNDQSIRITDDGIPGNGITLIDTGGTGGFESLAFAAPSQSFTVQGGKGNNAITVESVDSGFAAELIIDAQSGSDTIDARAFSGDLTMIGGAGPDTLLGGSGVNTVIGGAGNNTFVAGGGTNMFETTPGGTLPEVFADSYETTEGTAVQIPAEFGVLANDLAAGGLSLTAVLVEAPEHGDLALLPDGSFEYTPYPDFQGEDSFTYRASAGEGLDSNLATVTIVVEESANPCHNRENEAFLHNGNLHVVGTNDSSGVIDDVIIVMAFDPANITVSLNNQLLGPFNLAGTGGRIIICGLDGNDVIMSMGYMATEVFGGKGNDIIFGSYADDVLRGEEGDDVIFAKDGNDVAVGGLGADIFFGQDGADLLITGHSDRSYEDLRRDRQTGSENGAVGLADLLASVGDDDAVDLVFGGAGSDLVVGESSMDGFFDESNLDGDLFVELAGV